MFEEQPFSTKTIYGLTKKMDNKPDVKLKHCRKYFSQQWDREGLPTSIKEMLLVYFGNVDLRNYDRQSAEDLKEIYDKAGFRIKN
ncbi:MAG: XerD/XerC family integrase [Candidatus Methanohalarchaeum thermophilum]|uniref:XerD/XerC family integrase n=1 Tax=Methanohalarchaeum thermophilum TaxID=1903181 RepID=A0A1Q6DWX6_METT1|nr:MAG: XerD/XerC family integrase [Candidatus Methanohalarchaeum thermophilum]